MSQKRISSNYITQLAPNEVFVFGSNLQGKLGGGADRLAYREFGAEWGQGACRAERGPKYNRSIIEV